MSPPPIPADWPTPTTTMIKMLPISSDKVSGKICLCWHYSVSGMHTCFISQSESVMHSGRGSYSSVGTFSGGFVSYPSSESNLYGMSLD